MAMYILTVILSQSTKILVREPYQKLHVFRGGVLLIVYNKQNADLHTLKSAYA